MKKTSFILQKRINQHGLGGVVISGQLCRQAQLLYPSLFEAVSFKAGVLHVQVEKAQLTAFKMVQGKLVEELNLYAESHQLPIVERLRLTFY